MNTISTYVNDRLHHHHGQSPWHEADRLSMTPPPGERPLDGTATGRVTADRLAAILAARPRKQELITSRAAARPAAPRKKEKPPEEKPPAPQRDGLAALRQAAAKRRTIA